MKTMELTPEQIRKLETLLDDPWSAIGPSMARNNPFFVLKAINDQMKQDGYDDFYELNARGEALGDLYEEIYKQNEHLMKS